MAFHCFVVPKALATQAIRHVSHGAGIVHHAAVRALLRPPAAPAAAADTCSAPVNALRAMRALAGLPAAALVAGGMGLGAAAATLATPGAPAIPAAYQPGSSYASARAPVQPLATEVASAAAIGPANVADTTPIQDADASPAQVQPAPDAVGPRLVQRLAAPPAPNDAPSPQATLPGTDAPVETPQRTPAHAAPPTEVPEPASVGLFMLPVAIAASSWLARRDRRRAHG